jgi:hypothetical protein
MRLGEAEACASLFAAIEMDNLVEPMQMLLVDDGGTGAVQR